MLSTTAEAVDIHQPRIWIKPHYSSFNGIRGVAVLTVFMAHFGGFWSPKISAFTWEGVDLFFVLSGFLITGILYDSLDTPSFFRNFYIRRALRIFPVFYALCILLLILTPLIHLHYSWTLFTFFLYIGNLLMPFIFPAHNPTVIWAYWKGSLTEVSNIGHFWSLCIEEQFYLLWPSVIWFVRDRKRLMRVCVVGIIVTLLGRFILREYFDRMLLLYWSTYTRCDTLLIGAWLALWLREYPLSLQALRRLSLYFFWVPVIIVLAVMSRFSHSYSDYLVFDNRFMCTFGYTLIALASAALLLRSLDDASLLSRVLRNPLLSGLGIISYGFYLFHMPMEAGLGLLSREHPQLRVFVPVIAFALTFTLAKLSFHFFETPFLRLKRVLAPQQMPIDAARAPITAHLHVAEPEV